VESIKISVIAPVYNAAPFLHKCIDSVLSQSLKEIEMICVNDGSTDNSAQILDEYARKHKNVKVVHQQNLNAGVARNTGLNIALGEYIIFLDADDYLADDVCIQVYDIVKHHNLDHLKTKSWLIDAFSDQLVNRQHYSLPTALENDYTLPFSFSEAAQRLTTSPPLPPWNGIYRKKYLIDNNITFDAMRYANDHTFYYASVVNAKRIMCADIKMVYHRVNNPDSLVGNFEKRWACCFEAFNVIKERYKYLPQNEYNMIMNACFTSLYGYVQDLKARGYDAVHVIDKYNELLNTYSKSELELIHARSNAIWYMEYLLDMLEHNIKSPALNDAMYKSMQKEIRNNRWCYSDAFNQITASNQIIIYGAGNMGKHIHRFITLSEYCNIYKWVDKNWKALALQGYPVSNPNEVTESNHFDYVVIAIMDNHAVNEAKAFLTERNVCHTKIIELM